MSAKVMGLVWDSTLEDAATVAVLLYLANCGDDDGMNAFPGVARIASRARYSERTVKRVIAQLAIDGWISIVERGGGQGHTSAYEVDVERLQQCQRVTVVKRKGTVPRRAGKGATGARKGAIDDNPPHPLFGRTVRETSGTITPWPPQAGVEEGLTGDLSKRVLAAMEQVSSALGIEDGQRRTRRMIRDAVKRACEKGDPPATVALGMIAAVRRQAELHERSLLKFQFGLHKFLGLGIWRDESRWGWDNQEAKLQAVAKAGSWG